MSTAFRVAIRIAFRIALHCVQMDHNCNFHRHFPFVEPSERSQNLTRVIIIHIHLIILSLPPVRNSRVCPSLPPSPFFSLPPTPLPHPYTFLPLSTHPPPKRLCAVSSPAIVTVLPSAPLNSLPQLPLQQSKTKLSKPYVNVNARSKSSLSYK